MERFKHFLNVILCLFLVLVFIIFFPACDPEEEAMKFIAVGGLYGFPGVFCSSTDGVNWNFQDKSVNRIWGITYGDGWFIGVGDSGYIFRSQDGQTYNEVVLDYYDFFHDVAAGERRDQVPWKQFYVAVGHHGLGESKRGLVAYSSDHGATWTYADPGTKATLTAIAYGLTDGSTRFVVVGSVPGDNDMAVIKFSNDAGATWINHSYGGSSEVLGGVAYGNGRYIAVGQNGTIIYSPNGAAWYPAVSNTNDDLFGVAYGNFIWVAVGERGRILYSNALGTSWTELVFDLYEYWYDVTFGDGRFVAVGDQKIITSTDGVNWTYAATFTDPDFWFFDVIYRRDTW
jgi:photosystem II stability/assembly factor-like uncharacterized protein